MKKKLTINSDNILPIIKKWLYSEKDIFIRELVSNSSDAISKLKIINPKEKDFSIKIKVDKDKKTISISDNGIGMTYLEVEKYISEIAFSGAEEFLKKHKKEDRKDQIIGHFGLGFYSAFISSKKVTITTQSYNKKEKSVFWTSDGSSAYEIDTIDPIKRGTTVTLFIDDESLEFLEEAKIKETLLKYCPFFSFPIYLNDTHINNKDPLWLKNSKDCTEKEYLAFYKDLYPFDPDPIFYIHLNVDFPFNLKGILYFPKIENNFDLQKSHTKLFSNRVFVTDSVKGILPEHLSVLKGAMDSFDIPLNVSRSYLQVDKTVKQLGTHISKKIADKLTHLYKNDKEKFTKIWPDIEVIIKLSILNDDKFFEKSKNFLIFENLDGKWTTIEEYLKRNKDQKKIFYSTKDKYSENFLKMYKDTNIEVIFTNPYIDISLISLLEQKMTDIKFTRVDGSIDDSLLDPSKEKTLLDESGKSLSSTIAETIKNSLDKDIEVEAKSLTNADLSSFILIKEEDRRLNDFMHFTQNKALPIKHSFIVNTNNKLINKIFALHSSNPKLAKRLTKVVYDMALLSQKELKSQDLSGFVNRSNSLLEELTELVK